MNLGSRSIITTVTDYRDAVQCRKTVRDLAEAHEEISNLPPSALWKGIKDRFDLLEFTGSGT